MTSDNLNQLGFTIVESSSDENIYDIVFNNGIPDNSGFATQIFSGLRQGEALINFESEDNNTEPTREGYTFMGWAPTLNPTVSMNDANNGEIIYTATWMKN